ncbi:MAG: pyridoxamine 5'-phosphate oxidase family protein [Thermostichales cyanobacterium BF4_bins_65]
MTVSPRPAIAAALRHQGREGRFLQMATVDPQGYPRNRTVVFRGWQGECDLILATDSRSQKIQDLHACPYSELCWYFPKTREQFRLFGPVQLITQTNRDPQWQQSWQQMSPQGRQLWYWPHPAQPLAPPESFQEVTVADTPPDTFVLMILSPQTVDHLQLRGDGTYPQTRHHYHRQGSRWLWRAVNP